MIQKRTFKLHRAFWWAVNYSHIIQNSPSTCLYTIISGLIGQAIKFLMPTYLIDLSDTMSSILSLKILMRVPIRIEDDYRIGSLQIKTQPPSTCREKEDEYVLSAIVELFQQIPTLLRTCGSVKSQVAEIAIVEVILQKSGWQIDYLAHSHRPVTTRPKRILKRDSTGEGHRHNAAAVKGWRISPA